MVRVRVRVMISVRVRVRVGLGLGGMSTADVIIRCTPPSRLASFHSRREKRTLGVFVWLELEMGKTHSTHLYTR
jgi:hypothetical protein